MDVIEKVPRDVSRGGKGLSKLADLAQTINQWEDDIHTVSVFQI